MTSAASPPRSRSWTSPSNATAFAACGRAGDRNRCRAGDRAAPRAEAGAARRDQRAGRDAAPRRALAGRARRLDSRPRKLARGVHVQGSRASRRFFTDGIGFQVSDESRHRRELPALLDRSPQRARAAGPVLVPAPHGLGDGRRGCGRARRGGDGRGGRVAPRLGPRPARDRIELLLVPARPGGQLRRVLERSRRDRRRRSLEGGRVEPAHGLAAWSPPVPRSSSRRTTSSRWRAGR